MRIALCIHGLYRNHVSPGPKEIVKRLHTAFADADVYYHTWTCLLYTSPSPRDRTRSRMPSSA